MNVPNWLKPLAHRLVGAAYREYKASTSTSVPEITPYTPRAAEGNGVRLNLIVPSINSQHYFGGIDTAVALYRELCACYPRSRVILSDAAPEGGALDRLPGHILVNAEASLTAPRQVTAYNDRYGKHLAIEPGDRWLTTAWWTAYAAQALAEWQEKNFGKPGELIYLIQDYEPGFYAWSSQHLLALSTYRPERDYAVFNTRLLADYFAAQGYQYRRQLTFEPTLNAGLRDRLAQLPMTGAARERKIVIYGRPSTPRNAFELICEGLRLWAAQDQRASEWQVLSPGELTQVLDLGAVRIQGLGKLDLQHYAELLATSAIGISLMVSPHPSYPPLEMASFGMRVLTNSFANKDLSSWSPNIASMSATPDDIARHLSRACDEFEHRQMLSLPVLQPGAPFLGESSFANLAARLAEDLRA